MLGPRASEKRCVEAGTSARISQERVRDLRVGS
jgi:hypothetical protein